MGGRVLERSNISAPEHDSKHCHFYIMERVRSSVYKYTHNYTEKPDIQISAPTAWRSCHTRIWFEKYLNTYITSQYIYSDFPIDREGPFTILRSILTLIPVKPQWCWCCLLGEWLFVFQGTVDRAASERAPLTKLSGLQTCEQHLSGGGTGDLERADIHQWFNLIFNLDFYGPYRPADAISQSRSPPMGWGINSSQPRSGIGPSLGKQRFTVHGGQEPILCDSTGDC